MVVLVHGLAEHSGRYAPLALRLVAEGYAVSALDLRGHGRSDGQRVYIDSFRQHLQDVAQFFQYVRSEQPQRPYFLFGHSMGGLIATCLAAEELPGLQGVALSAAGLQVHQRVAPLLRRLAPLASLLLPKLRIMPLNFQRVSRDPEAVAAVEADPLVYHGRMPNRTGYELLQAGLRLRPRLVAVRQPLLILHGTADFITDPEGSRQLYQQAASTDKTLKLYEGLYHNLFDEPEKEQLIADLLAWLAPRRG